MLAEIHVSGVEHGDFHGGHVVVDSSGRPFIIDFDQAKPHACGQEMTIQFHEKEPDPDEFGCKELWRACREVGAWTPRQYFISLFAVMFYLPCAI